jgi:hypothetical protein
MLFLALLLGMLAPCAQAQTPLEYQVKASSIYHFLYFIRWPDDVFDEKHTLQVCILGQDRFGKVVDVLEDQVVEGRRIRVRKMPSYDKAEASTCQVLFISDSLSRDLAKILGDLRGRSVLTIGETEGFLQNGGTINFVVADNRLQFELNRSALNQARLTVSDKLLRLSRVK